MKQKILLQKICNYMKEGIQEETHNRSCCGCGPQESIGNKMEIVRLFLGFLVVGVGAVHGATISGREDMSASVLKNVREERIARSVEGTSKDHKHFCGNSDKPVSFLKRKKRFIPRGIRWEKKNLTWRLKNYTPRLNPEDTIALVRSAFNQWETYSALTFKEIKEGKADIEISFEPKKHLLYGDVYCKLEFDGPGGTIGHAFYPMKYAAYRGNIHFDRDERFSVDGSTGFNFGSAVLHEIGHSLGLLHSDTQYSIMHPDYAMSAKGKFIPLMIDDIDGIQSIYGPPFKKEKHSNDVEIKNAVVKMPHSEKKKAKIITTTAMSNTSPATKSPPVDNDVDDGTNNNKVEPNAPMKVTNNRVEIPLPKSAVAEKRKPVSKTLSIQQNSANPPLNPKTITEGQKSKVKKPAPEVATTKMPALLTKSLEEDVQPKNQSKDEDTESSSLDRNPKCPETFDALFVSKVNSNTYIFNGLFTYSIGKWLGYNKQAFYTRNRYLFRTVDAVYRTKDGQRLFVFSGQLYAVYRDDIVLERYGAIYDFGFPFTIKKIDAALIFGPYKNTYFFTGENYWRYNEKTRKMDPGYPKRIDSVWKGVPSNVDAAITWKNDLTYFFKGKNYYRLHTRTASVEYGYPKPIRPIWTRC